jgi:hypothetical protein
MLRIFHQRWTAGEIQAINFWQEKASYAVKLLWHQPNNDSESYQCLEHILPSLQCNQQNYSCVSSVSVNISHINSWVSFLIDYVSCKYTKLWIIYFITDIYIYIYIYIYTCMCVCVCVCVCYIGSYVNFTISQSWSLFLHSMANLQHLQFISPNWTYCFCP